MMSEMERDATDYEDAARRKRQAQYDALEKREGELMAALKRTPEETLAELHAVQSEIDELAKQGAGSHD